MKLIDKDALVAEIERRIEGINPISQRVGVVGCSNTIKHLRHILSFIDAVEVKEVDLEKYYHDFLQKEWFDKTCNRTMSEMMAFTAKHFFELGLKAQKGE